MNLKKLLKKYSFVCVIGVLLTLNFTHILNHEFVSWDSMLPNYKNHDSSISSIVPAWDGLERGDVVMVKAPTGSKVIKRIIGLPGETVEIKNDIVYINNEPLDEPYIQQESASVNRMAVNIGPILLGDDEYYIMGDNRDHSTDSRAYGPIKRDAIFGVELIHLSL